MCCDVRRVERPCPIVPGVYVAADHGTFRTQTQTQTQTQTKPERKRVDRRTSVNQAIGWNTTACLEKRSGTRMWHEPAPTGECAGPPKPGRIPPDSARSVRGDAARACQFDAALPVGAVRRKAWCIRGIDVVSGFVRKSGCKDRSRAAGPRESEGKRLDQARHAGMGVLQ